MRSWHLLFSVSVRSVSIMGHGHGHRDTVEHRGKKPYGIMDVRTWVVLCKLCLFFGSACLTEILSLIVVYVGWLESLEQHVNTQQSDIS
ncbi:hypothetical protein KIPB_011758, partial [Kipferlia bialata]|eukprot:g11758.t1